MVRMTHIIENKPSSQAAARSLHNHHRAAVCFQPGRSFHEARVGVGWSEAGKKKRTLIKEGYALK